jgi:signal transduction histidine kinase
MLQARAKAVNTVIPGLWERLVRPHPSITDVERRRQSRLLASFQLALLAASNLGWLNVLDTTYPAADRQLVLLILLIAQPTSLGLYFLNRAGKYKLATVLYLLQISVALLVTLADPSATVGFVYFIAGVLLMGAMLLTAKEFLVLAAACVAVQVVFAVAAPKSSLVSNDSPLTFTGLFAPLIVVFLNHRASLERERRAELEQRVAERTRDLQVAADVSRQITTILNLDELLHAVVERTRGGFNLSHASVFLYDPESGNLVFEVGSGRVGEMMKARKWHFHVPGDSGLVPEAARTRAAVIINDVRQDKRHVPNPLLPATLAEMSLPMVVGDRLIGVLDLQSEQVNRFSEDDARVMISLAEQIAVAVNNARLYSEQVQVAEQLREIDNMKSGFLASMSHELRTPLNAILNFTKFVASGLLGEINEKQVDALTKTIDSGRHLLSLINDVLDISKIESKMLTLFVENDVNLQDELNTALAAAETLLIGKPVMLLRDIDPDLPIMVGDRRRIRQIILNLVSNACKFTETGSITIGASVRGDMVQIYVRDTGPGIAPEDQELIFEAFRQTRTGLSQGGGTGLGLAIARRLAEAHGGQLWLESTPGHGATFFVQLPIQSERLRTLATAVAGA